MKQQRFPCHRHPTDPQRHSWQFTASHGWYRCEGCGLLGVCIGCLVHNPVPTGVLPMACAAHTKTDHITVLQRVAAVPVKQHDTVQQAPLFDTPEKEAQ